MGKINLQNIITSILVLVWMTTVFIFSSQDGTQTLNTSGAFIHAVESTVKNEGTHVESNTNSNNNTDKIKSQKTIKYKYSDEIQLFVRKNAHYFLYLTGGIILSAFFYAQNKANRRYTLYTIVTGIVYSMTDEFHQKFVPGRTSSIKDVGIDSLGVITGVVIFILIIYVLRRRKLKLGEGKDVAV